MNWIDAADEYYRGTAQHDYQLTALPAAWQRELVALKLLDDGVNWSGYLTFFVNRGRETYEYAVRALRAIGASRTAALVERCQALIDEHAPPDRAPRDLLPNEVLARDGTVLKPAGSVLPNAVLARLRDLSDRYMRYPDSVGDLAEKHFAPLIAADQSGR